MGIKVLVNSVPTTRVSINEQERSSVRTVNVMPETPKSTLVSLTDVDATSIINNDTVVYEASSGKFVIKVLPLIDGGTF
jgi:hypothetical protein